jgi:protein TonB
MEATVVLQLLIGVDGRVKEGRVAKSSGHPSLDETALKEAARAWKLTPFVENGAAIEKWGNFQVTFKLTE